MIMAHNGVTHMQPGVPVDFVPLSEWAEYRSIFHLLRKIKFFKQFLIRKAFKAWVRHHRRQRFLKARGRVAEQAYMVNAVYQRSLLIMRASTVAIQDLCFAPLLPHMTYSLSMLDNIQEEGFSRTTEAVKKITRSMDEEFALLKASLHDQLEGLDKTAYESRPRTATRWRNPRLMSGLENQLLAVEIQIAKLPVFKRLAFTILAQELIGFASRSPMHDYLPAMDPTQITGRGLFWMQVHSVTATEPFAARPSGVDLYGKIHDGYEELANLVLSLCREYAKTHVALKWYQDARGIAIEDHLVQSVLAHPKLTHALALIEQNIVRDRTTMANVLEDQAWIWDVLVFVREWDANKLESYKHNLDDIFQMLVKVDQWSKDLKQTQLLRMSPEQMFCVDNRLIGTMLIPRLGSIFRDVDELFIARILVDAHDTLRRIKNRVAELTHATAMDNPTLPQYTQFVAGVRKAQKQVTSSKNDVTELERLFGEHVRNRAFFLRKAEERLDATLADLNAKHTEFLRMVSAANALRNALAPMMSGKLQIRLRHLEKQINSIEMELQNAPFVRPSYKPLYILDRLREVGVRQRLITEEAKDIAQALKIVTEDIPDMRIFENGIVTLDIRRKIWELRETFSTTMHQFLTTPFNEVEVEVMLAKLMEWRLESCSLLSQQTAAATRITSYTDTDRRLSISDPEAPMTGIILATVTKVKWKAATSGPREDKVLAHLLGRLDRILDMGTVLKQLNHEAFKVRHWKALFAALGRHYDPACKYTLCSLLAVQIGDYDLLVDRLNILARLEDAQYNELQDVKQFWGEQILPFEPRCVPVLNKKKVNANAGMPSDPTARAKWRWQKVAQYMLVSMRQIKHLRKNAAKNLYGSVTMSLERNLLGDDGADMLGNTDTIETNLADHMVVMNRILGSGSDEFKDVAEDWLTNFQALGEILSTWRHVQQLWSSLSQIFHNFSHPLVEERISEFNAVDKSYRNMTKQLTRSPLVMTLLAYRKTDSHYRELQGPRLRESLSDIQKGLEVLLHGINTEVLKEARGNSPRLYFLTDAELLTMLNQPYVPSSKSHSLAVRCFSGVLHLRCTRLDDDTLKNADEGEYRVDGFEGMAGKCLMFNNPVIVDRKTKLMQWHGEVEEAMKTSLRELLVECLSAVGKKSAICDVPTNEYEALLTSWPLQIVVVSHEIWFTRLVDSALRGGSSNAHARLAELCEGWAGMCDNLNEIILRTTAKQSHAYRSILGDLFLTVLHQREKLAQLCKEERLGPTMYAWQRHCRYAADVIEDQSLPDPSATKLSGASLACTVSCLNTTINYTHEFLGASENFMYITPLTERNFLNIAMAIHGFTMPILQSDDVLVKTSTARQAAARLGRNLSEIMCSSETECDLVLRLLTGVMKVGNWLLFRSIHRLDSGPKSLLSVCLLKLYWSHASATDGIDWTGDSGAIPWNADAGFLATTVRTGALSSMPALSDGLKSALRPMYLVSLDLDVMVETEFILCGFASFRGLTQSLRHFKVLLQSRLKALAPRLGARTLKDAIHQAAGNFGHKVTPTERSQVVEALSAILEPALDTADRALFRKCLLEAFPSSKEKKKMRIALDDTKTGGAHTLSFAVQQPDDNAGYNRAVDNAITELGLQRSQAVVDRIAKLNLVMKQSKNVVIFGKAGSGKTTLTKLLALVRSDNEACPDPTAEATGLGGKHPIDVLRLYPSALSHSDLMGAFDGSGTWVDGVIPRMIRNRMDERLPPKKWIVFDGWLGSEWIGRLDSVVSSESEVTLPSGEVLPVSSSTKFLFESHDLSGASPNMLTDSALFHVPPDVIQMKDVLQAWNIVIAVEFPTVYAYHRNFIADFLYKVIGPTVTYIRKEFNMHISEMDGAKNYLTILQSVLALEINRGESNDSNQISRLLIESTTEQLRKLLSSLSIFAYVAAVDGYLPSGVADKMDAFYRAQLAEANPEISLPERGLLHEYFVDPVSMDLHHHTEHRDFADHLALGVEISSASGHMPIISEIVPRYTILKALLCNGVPFFVSGPSGSGKSAMIQKLWKDNQHVLGMMRLWSMSQNVTSSELRTALTENVVVRDPHQWHAMSSNVRTLNKKASLMLFVDDINLAADRDEDNVAELLRQLLDEGSFHDSEARARSVRNMACVAAGTTLEGFKCSDRLARHFVAIRHGFTEQESIHSIFSPMLAQWVQNLAPLIPSRHVDTISSGLKELVQATADVDAALRVRDDDDSNDNVFNLRMLAQVFSSLLVCVPCEQALLEDGPEFNILDLSDDDSLDMGEFFDSDSDDDAVAPADPMTDAPFLIPHVWYTETMNVFLPHIPPNNRSWLQAFLAERCEGIFAVMTAGLEPKIQPRVPMTLAWKPMDAAPDVPVLGEEVVAHKQEFWETTEVNEAAQLFQSFAPAPRTSNQHCVRTVVTHDLALELGALCQSITTKQHSVLVGHKGSGRRRLSMLAARVTNRELHIVDAPSNGSLAEFRRRITPAVHLANRTKHTGKMLLIVSNKNPITAAMMSDIYALMRHGWIPGMKRENEFLSHDLLAIGRGETTNAVESGRLIVHLLLDDALVSASDGEQKEYMFRTLGIFTPCARIQTIIWSSDTRVGIAQAYLNDKLANSPDVTRLLMALKKRTLSKDKHVVLSSDMVGRLSKLLNDIHEHAAKTPTTAMFADGNRFCIMVDTFTFLFKRQIKWLDTNMRLAQTLIDRVSRADDIIGEFQGQINQIIPIRNKANAKCDALYNKAVQKRDALANTVKTRIELEKSIKDTTLKIDKLTGMFDRELMSCLSELKEAEDALLSLQQKDIEEMAAYNDPPDKVVMTTAPICLLFRPYRTPPNFAAFDPRLPREKQPATWIETKLLLNKHHFFDDIVNFDKDGISSVTLKMIQKIVYGGLYVPENLQTASLACYSLAQWVLAIVKYAEIQLRLEPFRKELRAAEAELVAQLKLLQKLRDQEERLRLEVRAAKAELTVAQEHRQKVLDQLREVMLRQSRARKLLDDTGSLVGLVQDRLLSMQAALSTLPGDLALASACMNYTGTLNAEDRTGLIAFWSRRCAHWEVPTRDQFSFEDVLASPEDIAYWKSQGLAHDSRTLIGDVVMMRTSSRWPLIYDPYEYAANLLVQIMEGEGHQLTQVSSNSATLTADVAAAMRNGDSILISDMENNIRLEDTHPELVNLLIGERCRMTDGVDTVLYEVGEEQIEVPATFRVYMSRHGPFQPHDLARPVCLVHFDDPAIAHEQLLGTFVMIDSPSIESDLKASNASVMKSIQQLKADRMQLMERMQHVTVTDFDTDTFTNQILEINASHEEGRHAAETESERRRSLFLLRSVHRDVATHATVLFQFVLSLERFGSQLNRYSMPSFVQMFKAWIIAQKGATERTKSELSLHDMRKTLNRRVRDWFGAGINHLQLQEFSIALTLETMRLAHDVTQEEIDLFQTMKEDVSVTTTEVKPVWLSDAAWARVVQLAELEPFKLLTTELAEQELWEEYLQNGPSVYDRVPFTEADASVLSSFHKVLLIQALQPSSLPEACRELVVSQLGDDFFEKPEDLFAEVIAEPKPSVPILVLLSDDSDPLFDIMQFVYASKARNTSGQHSTLATEDDRDTPEAWYSKSANITFVSSAEVGWSVRNLRLKAPTSICSQPVVVISLGGEKIGSTIKVIREAYTEGRWVVLHNCHLACQATLLHIADEFTSLTTSKIHSSGFRLWLTSRETASIPTAILLPALKLQWRQCMRRGHRRKRWANRIMRSPLFGATHAKSCALVAEDIDFTLSEAAAVQIPEAFQNENRIYASASLFKLTKGKFEADKLVHEQRRAELARRLEAREVADFDRSWQVADALSAISSADLLMVDSDSILDVAAQFIFYASPWTVPYVLSDHELEIIFRDIFAPFVSSPWQLEAAVQTLKTFACPNGAGLGNGQSLNMATESDVLPILHSRMHPLTLGQLSAFMLNGEEDRSVTLLEGGQDTLIVPTAEIRDKLAKIFGVTEDAMAFLEHEDHIANRATVVAPQVNVLHYIQGTVTWATILEQTARDSHTQLLLRLRAVRAQANKILSCVNKLNEWDVQTHAIALKLARGFVPCEWTAGDRDIPVSSWCDLVGECKKAHPECGPLAEIPGAPFSVNAQALCDAGSLLIALRKSIADQWHVHLEQVGVTFTLGDTSSDVASPGIGVPLKLAIGGVFLVGASWRDERLESQFATTSTMDVLAQSVTVTATFSLQHGVAEGAHATDTGTFQCPFIGVDHHGETILGKVQLAATPRTLPVLHANGAHILMLLV